MGSTQWKRNKFRQNKDETWMDFDQLEADFRINHHFIRRDTTEWNQKQFLMFMPCDFHVHNSYINGFPTKSDPGNQV